MYPGPHLDLTHREFQVSPELNHRLEGLDFQEIDVARGPAALTVMGVRPDLVFAREAWPHTDPSWEGCVFFSMTAIGLRYQFCTVSNPDGHVVPAGMVFNVDPMELHWLRPDALVSHYWLGLQWEVELERRAEFSQALAAAIEHWNRADFVLPVLGAN